MCSHNIYTRFLPQTVFSATFHVPDDYPFGNCLPGTELLQSSFRIEFSMGSLTRQHWWCLRRHRQSLRHCRDPWGDRRTRGHRLLRHSLNVVKHNKTSWNTCKTLWYTEKRRKTPWTTSKTSWNILKTLWNIWVGSPTTSRFTPRNAGLLDGVKIGSPTRTRVTPGNTASVGDMIVG